MGNLINILNEKKYYNAAKTNLIVPLSLDAGEQLSVEGAKYQNISLSELYDIERDQSLLYSVYGKISPIFNFKTETIIESKPNDITFNFRNKSNWNLLILRPSSEEKTTIEYSNGNQIDFTKGLPLIPIEAVEIDGVKRIGFRSIFKHDFAVGDTIQITDTTNYVGNKNYNIVSVYDDIFYINKTYTTATASSTSLPSLSSIKVVQNLDLSLLQRVTVTELNNGINKITILDEANGVDLSNIKYQIYAKKLDNGIPRKYYIKILRVMDLSNDFDALAFAKTPFGGDVYEFTFNKQLSADYVDNMGYPIDRLYLGLIKLAKTPNMTIGPVFAKFLSQKFTTNNTDILELISYGASYSDNVYTTGVNDSMLYGLVSYNFDELTEQMINPIEHFFTLNPNAQEIKFGYNPFTEIQIRQKSTYIESSETLGGTPPYAYYDEKRELYRWRDLYSPGIVDITGAGIDLPFLNGAHYVYSDIIFNLKNYNTPKYSIGYNSIQVDYTKYDSSIKELFDDTVDINSISSNNNSLTPNANVC